MDRFLLEAMREVDELTPACPPIAPPVRTDWHRAAAEHRSMVAEAEERYAALVEHIDAARRARIRG